MVKLKDCPTDQKSLVEEKLGDQWWRLNNLYYILDENGNRVLFRLNAVQKIFYLALWWLNIVLKSRQHGITTFVCIYFLDQCLFNSNMRAGIVCHKLDDAKRIFRDKIKYAYDNLPQSIKRVQGTVKDDACQIILENNSSIYVGTSMRSGTLQLLHVSEYGWLCAHAVQKASEIKTGAMETVHENGIIIIESTAEGMNNDFHLMCEAAQKATEGNKELSRMDYKFHFFAWYDKPENVLVEDVEIDQKTLNYFERIEAVADIKISQPHRNWYAKKRIILKSDMLKEHPSTPEEAFMASMLGAYFGHEMIETKKTGRIGEYPWVREAKVFTFWDIGSIHTAIWYWQFIREEIRVIDVYYDNTGQGLISHIKLLQDKPYIYGEHWAGWDMNPEMGSNRKNTVTGNMIIDEAKELGIDFKICSKILFRERIDAGRRVIPKCKFNKETTAIGVSALFNFRQSINKALSTEDRTVFNNEPAKGPEVHIAEAFTHGALAYINSIYVDGVRMGQTKQQLPVSARKKSAYNNQILTRGMIKV